MTENTTASGAADALRAAMHQAFNLGQTYWQQADSESYAEQDKSGRTYKKYKALLEETCTTLAECAPVAPAHLTFSQWWTDVGHMKVAEMANSNGWRGAAEAGYAAGVLQVAPTATEQDVMDAKRYQWLFGARTKDQVTSVSSTVFNPLPQDFVLSELQCFYTHKAMADAMIDDAMAAQKSRESQS